MTDKEIKESGLKPEYLGDGLYVKYDGIQFCLMANHHEYPSDKVYLEDKVLENFFEYINKIRAIEKRDKERKK
jgi:hypothetical protein